MDRQLKNIFGKNFSDLFYCNYDFVDTKNKEELNELYNGLKKNLENNVTKDKLRKWFIDNIEMIEEYYNSIN
jgi:hypothetical protein